MRTAFQFRSCSHLHQLRSHVRTILSISQWEYLEGKAKEVSSIRNDTHPRDWTRWRIRVSVAKIRMFFFAGNGDDRDDRSGWTRPSVCYKCCRGCWASWRVDAWWSADRSLLITKSSPWFSVILDIYEWKSLVNVPPRWGPPFGREEVVSSCIEVDGSIFVSIPIIDNINI